jgi:hypothetical protein
VKDLLHIGQWQGFFVYGPEYGNLLEGKEAEFRFFIEEYNQGKFSGKVIDWEGIGADGEVSAMEGFIEHNTIRFTKQYAQLMVIDEWGNTTDAPGLPGHQVSYEGNFDVAAECFYGSWEISISMEQVGEFSVEEIARGTWRMKL